MMNFRITEHTPELSKPKLDHHIFFIISIFQYEVRSNLHQISFIEMCTIVIELQHPQSMCATKRDIHFPIIFKSCS